MTAAARLPKWRLRRELKFTGEEGAAARRLKQLGAIARFRTDHGIFSEPLGWLCVVCDALAVLGSHHDRFRSEARRLVVEGVVAPDGEYLSPAEVEAALDAANHRDRLLSNRSAGREIGLRVAELIAIRRASGMAITLHPVDESSEERSARLAQQKREAAAQRKRRQRAREHAKCVTPFVTLRCVGPEKVTSKVTKPVTPVNIYTQRDEDLRPEGAPSAVMVALAAGCVTVSELTEATGCSPASVRMALGRLVRRGTILKASRGKYQLPSEER